MAAEPEPGIGTSVSAEPGNLVDRSCQLWISCEKNWSALRIRFSPSSQWPFFQDPTTLPCYIYIYRFQKPFQDQGSPRGFLFFFSSPITKPSRNPQFQVVLSIGKAPSSCTFFSTCLAPLRFSKIRHWSQPMHTSDKESGRKANLPKEMTVKWVDDGIKILR